MATTRAISSSLCDSFSVSPALFRSHLTDFVFRYDVLAMRGTRRLTVQAYAPKAGDDSYLTTDSVSSCCAALMPLYVVSALVEHK
jgi:hypothetical protein